jgi:hypothetical protein
MTSGKLILLGDFNFHYNDHTNSDANKFRDVLHAMNREQHVETGTHTHGNILDLVITRSSELEIENLDVYGQIFSDHSPIVFEIPVGKPSAIRVKCMQRKIKEINIAALEDDIKSQLNTSTCSSVNDLVEKYNSTLSDILEKHASVNIKQHVLRPLKPWFNKDIQQAKKDRRKAERKWRASKLEVHHQIFKQAQNNVTNACAAAKIDFYCGKIESCNKDQKMLFTVLNDLLKRNKVQSLPTAVDSECLANRFADFFTKKIEKIRSSFPASSNNDADGETTYVPLINHLKPVSEDELKKMIMSMKTKSCQLDPLPTSIIKESMDTMLPYLCEIVNRSFETSTFPDSLKGASVTPLIKKAGLDKDDLRNYRPISNLPFVSKVIEKAAISQLNAHITEHDLNEPMQSAYRSNHSVETALIKVINDLYCAIDQGKGVLLVLLDLSAAFDTVDTGILSSRLEKLFGITGHAMMWVKSYFKDRTQSVRINDKVSSNHPLDSLPQGSLFGPFAFPKYTAPIATICRKHDVSYHLYADDTQLYVDFESKDVLRAKAKLETCIEELRQFMLVNKLKLNDSKTEYMVICSKHFHKNIMGHSTIKVGNEIIPSTDSARNIGAIMDSELNLKAHVDNICLAII